MNAEFLSRVNMAIALFPYKVREMMEYGTYLVGVLDDKGDYDVYFDIRAWRVTHYGFWGDARFVCPRGSMADPEKSMASFEIGVIRGVGATRDEPHARLVKPKNFVELREFIVDNLVATNPAKCVLHDTPVVVALQPQTPAPA